MFTLFFNCQVFKKAFYRLEFVKVHEQHELKDKSSDTSIYSSFMMPVLFLCTVLHELSLWVTGQNSNWYEQTLNISVTVFFLTSTKYCIKMRKYMHS